MLKQNAKILTALKVVLDTFCVIAAFLTSWFFKFVLHLTPDTFHLPFARYAELLWISVPVFTLLQTVFGLYKSQRTRSVLHDMYMLLINAVLLFTAITVYLFIFKIYDVSRLLVGLFCATVFLFTASMRFLQYITMGMLRKKGLNLKHIVLVGLTEQGKAYLNAILRQKTLGYVPFGFMDTAETRYKNVPYLGTPSNLQAVLEANIIDEVVLALPLSAYDRLPALIDICEKCGVKSVIVPTYTEFLPAKPQMDEIENIPLLNTRYIPLDNLFFAAVKYGLDFLISAVLLLILSPLYLLLAVLVKCTSSGPVIFKQARVGYNKKVFNMYKFRTMYVNQSGSWTVENDPRVTPIGRFLRRTSLDELPQLLNVLKGEMSLVGPRPEQTAYVEQFKESIPKYMLKHRVRPGLTGWAQVHGLRGDTSIEARIQHDIYYIENWSLLLDFKILLITLFRHTGY